ncbi:MAG TPA: hypothetical protein VGG82_13055 [Casimicrobiaceae bacterium]
MARKKKTRQAPRRKRMTRRGRLSAARVTRWVEQYKGKDIVAGYANWFAVDPLCAVIELRILGVTIDAERESRMKAAIEARTTERKRRQELRSQARLEQLPPNSDETFAFIAGYTSAGAPYGITFEELGGEPPYFDDEDAEIEQAVAPEAGHLGGRSAELFGASVMNRYDPLQAPDPAEWLDVDEQERLDRVERYHRRARIDLPNCTLHATIHVAVENQLAADDEPAVRALARLMKEGLSRHDAVHAIGSLVAEQIYDLLELKDSPEALRARYCAALERLNAAQWRDGSGR